MIQVYRTDAENRERTEGRVPSSRSSLSPLRLCGERAGERGSVSIYVTLLLAFVLFGFLVMAFDLGRLYVVQAELQAATDAAALAAATRLVGTANSAFYASDQVTAAFDSTTGNENRFNLRLNRIGEPGADLLTELLVDYFSTLQEAQVNLNGGQSGANARYVRVQINAEAPVWFMRFLSPERRTRQQVSAAAIAGVSAPVCTACGLDPLAVTALDPTEEAHYGFTVGQFYTLYLTPSQQRPNLRGCLSQVPQPLEGTAAAVEYTILYHLPGGPDTGLDGELFRMGASGMLSKPGLDPPGCVTIGSIELAKPDLQGSTCATANAVGRDLICGLNTRFGVDPTTNACNNIESVTDLVALYQPDSDPGLSETLLQDYATEYDGNQRRVLTLAVVDAADTLSVLNFRQFLIENASNVMGLDPSGFTGAFRAQYLGHPVPIRTANLGGSCSVAAGVGRIVLHSTGVTQ